MRNLSKYLLKLYQSLNACKQSTEDRLLGREWVVYLLKCSDGSLYCGVTKDLKKRILGHNKGNTKYTRGRLPINLIETSRRMDKSSALKLEYKIKQLPRKSKVSFLRNYKP